MNYPLMDNFYEGCLGVSLILGQMAAIIIAIRGNAKSDRNATKLDIQASQIQEVHDATNGMKTDLVAAVTESSYAKGLNQGRAESVAALKELKR
jgi:hypothetical protein